MKSIITTCLCLVLALNAMADLRYQPIRFSLSTDKESYYEGEKITFNITITNTDKKQTFPVLIPHTQNVGQKLFFLNLYDKANNTMILRATEDRMLNMIVHETDTGSVKIKYLKPLEQIVIPISINDSENYFNYHTQNSSHHSFGVPVFAGHYKVNVVYNPHGIALGDSIYNYYDFFHGDLPNNGKLAMSVGGDMSHFIPLKIRRSADTVVSIERTKYYIKTDGDRYLYFSEKMDKIITDERCVHITNLPVDSFSLPKGEYFYSYFKGLYAEYIVRFDDGDIREYRKYRNNCPTYLYTEKYNDFKQKTLYAIQLPDQRFYSVTYGQPENKIHQESYCSADGTLCNVTTYIYNKKGKLVNKKMHQTQPCLEAKINGN
jgi:hypothetical protein